jgi:hypothetical protein
LKTKKHYILNDPTTRTAITEQVCSFCRP